MYPDYMVSFKALSTFLRAFGPKVLALDRSRPLILRDVRLTIEVAVSRRDWRDTKVLLVEIYLSGRLAMP